MSQDELVILILGGTYLFLNLMLVPLNMRYLVKMKEEREAIPDVNERYGKKTFEETHLTYSWLTGGVFLPSILMATVILKIKNKTSK